MKTEMTQEEYVKYHLENDIPCFCGSGSFVIAFDPIYNKRLGNDFSKPRNVLVFDSKCHYIIFAKFDIKTMNFTENCILKKIKIKGIKDQKTFENFVDNELNPYCRKHNCDYNTFFNGHDMSQRKEDSISIESPTNPNQKIIYYKTNNIIRFLEVYEGSKTVTDRAFKLGETYDNFINENNFAEFAKENFELCEEKGCSFEKYANEIAPKILELKSHISKYAKKIGAELRYTTFDKNVKTVFVYYNNGTTGVFKVLDDHQIFPVNIELPGSINSREEFKTLIKDNKAFINGEFNEQLEQYRARQELEKLTGANGAFKGHVRKR